MRAVALGQAFRIRLTGHMDLQYAADVAETFVRCALEPLEGAHVFNLEGTVCSMEELIAILERLRPGACRLITAEGPQVPVAYRMDGTQLRAHITGLPQTSLENGIRDTLEIFERLHRAGVAV